MELGQRYQIRMEHVVGEIRGGRVSRERWGADFGSLAAFPITKTGNKLKDEIAMYHPPPN